MKIQISFPEIQEIIKNKTGKDIIINMVDHNTIGISYILAIKVLFFGQVDKNFNLNISIKEINDTNVIMSYNCGKKMSLMITGALKMLKENPKLSFIEVSDNKQIIIKFGEIENVRSIFDKVEIQSINVIENGIEVTCKSK